ncbi:hypothetical protein [Pararhodobacter sp.]|uniref:hypothetical protein n=1 Tax=Pararhodobacter sp. TaxID=2127056 RepID=UPI002FDDD71F
MSDMRSRLDRIQREIEKHLREIEKLRAQESLLLEMLDERPPARDGRAPKGSVKTTVLELLEEVGAMGLNATAAVDLAEAKGIHLERGSVSSLLSRLKNDGVVSYNNDVYRLSPSASAPNVAHIRTSGEKAYGF